MKPTFGHIAAVVLLVFVFQLVRPILTQAQSKFQKQTLVTELIVTQKRWIARYRPYTYSFHSRTFKIDLMGGYRFTKPWSGYVWYRGDSNDKHLLGVRSDYTIKSSDRTILAKTEVRYFKALSNKHRSQLHIIESIGYQQGKVRPGLVGFYMNTIGQSQVLFIGPSFKVPFNSKSGVFSFYAKNVLGNDHWWLVFLYYKIDLSPRIRIPSTGIYMDLPVNNTKP